MLAVIAALLLQAAAPEPCPSTGAVPPGDASLVITTSESFPLPGVAVTVRCTAASDVFQLTTDAQGLASFVAPPSGRCVVSVFKRGFESGKRQRFHAVAAPVTLTFSMPIATTKCPTVIVPTALSFEPPGTFTLGDPLLKNLPISRDPSGVMSLAPGIH